LTSNDRLGRAAQHQAARSGRFFRGIVIEGKEKAITCARIADDMKSRYITILDLREISEVTEYFVISTVDNPRQLRALWTRIRHHFKKQKLLPLGEETDSDKWVLVDYNDVVVHIFLGEFREFYDLELLWGDAPRVDWQAKATKK